MGKVVHPKYFPFCPEEIEEPTGDGTYYPIGLTLAQAMKLYWVLRKITASSDLIGTTEPGEMTFAKTFIGPYEAISNEEEIVCQTYTSIQVELNELTPPISKFLSFAMQFLPKMYKEEENKFYPYIDGTADYSTGSSQFTSTTTNLTSPTGIQQGTLDFFGFGQIKLYTPPDDLIPGRQACPFSITATEWRSYGGTWDTSTGARLAD